MKCDCAPYELAESIFWMFVIRLHNCENCENHNFFVWNWKHFFFFFKKTFITLIVRNKRTETKNITVQNCRINSGCRLLCIWKTSRLRNVTLFFPRTRTVDFVLRSRFSSEIHFVGRTGFSFKAFHAFILSVGRHLSRSGSFTQLPPHWLLHITWYIEGRLFFSQLMSRMKINVTELLAFRSVFAASVNRSIEQP